METTLPQTTDESEAFANGGPHDSSVSSALDAAPGPVWYVSWPSGEQRGPIDAAQVRAWAAEGEVTADALLWRDGWGDWVQATMILPELEAVPAGFATVADPTGPTDAAALDVGRSAPAAAIVRRARANARGRRRTPGRNSTKVVGILAVVVLVLFVVLVWVIGRS